MDRNLTLNLVRVTEAAALQSARYLGRGDKIKADEAAVRGMRRMFDTLTIDGVVVIGEGEMDEAPMLYIGEQIGKATKDSIKVDIAVDPLDGTTAVAKGLSNAISAVAIAPRGCLLHAPDMYMEKIAVGPKAAGKVSLDEPVETNLKNLSKALNKDISDITVTILDRPRHKELIERVRKTGARIKLFQDGDVAAAIATCFEDLGVDILMGIGGAPEGVLAACALKCLGGEIQGRLYPIKDEEKERCKKMGLGNVDTLLTMDHLVRGNEIIFAATGVSNGKLLKGVVYYEHNRAKTYSVVMRGETGTIRFIEAIHRLDKKPEYAK
ncbi:class II fructose-bisphosphatase [Tepidimicrobium xylanilyticum]|uniref:Fructose-1,6-bisphosphatase n=1 Tax=Tepidimicrobium xylanilyticum TaxID=1123352 RepID=A0A1H2R5E1_9FIRM|nr:class II fructose-bisphosphatase [Tepidimicrobium xylanilyticum]GMG95514.1 fructose-bisphosphatase class II [Tepidimicrobium xylanilyticum]SDW14350.1 fructose-1,6-bisphosphatase II [Tepidimicrobium xylanilyticum]